MLPGPGGQGVQVDARAPLGHMQSTLWSLTLGYKTPLIHDTLEGTENKAN